MIDLMSDNNTALNGVDIDYNCEYIFELFLVVLDMLHQGHTIIHLQRLYSEKQAKNNIKYLLIFFVKIYLI